MARVDKPKHYENIVSFELAKLLRQNDFPQDTNRWGRSTDACHHYIETCEKTPSFREGMNTLN